MSSRANIVHIITAEYPPRVGGVSDHSNQIAQGLAEAGDEVHVWCRMGQEGSDAEHPGVAVHREAGSFTPRDLRRLGARLDSFASPRRLLVQWVPHSYGYRSVNLFFCIWLLRRANRGDRVELIVHEPWLPFSLRHPFWNAPALAHRLMTMVLLRAASYVWVSAPAWAERWKAYDFGGRTPFEWLPLPSGVPVAADPGAVVRVRSRVAVPDTLLIGYFGLIPQGVGKLLRSWSEPLLREPGRTVNLILIGKGSEECREQLVAFDPGAADRIHATGVLPTEQISHYMQACDLILQPYPGGANARRSSLIAALGHGLPVVTTKGPFTEEFWEESGAVALAADDDPAVAVDMIEGLLEDEGARNRLGRRAHDLYLEKFDRYRAIAALRRPAGPPKTELLS